MNESAELQYGYTRDGFLSLAVSNIRLQQNISEEVIQKGDADPDKVHLQKDGTHIYVKTRSNNVSFRGRLGRFVVAENITKRRHLIPQLLQLAYHDTLTGLPNRALLERMNQGFAAARERSHRTAIIYLDPDRVKEVKTYTGMRLGT